MPLSVPAMQPLDRTPSNHARYLTAGVRCFERDFDGYENKPPVKMVVFDCDETLTLSTFMPKNRELRSEIGWIEWAEFISVVNFESPFVDGSRIEKLGECLASLKEGDGSGERSITCLTRNESGAVACLNLLMMAKLDVHFDAIWSMQTSSPFGSTNACYKNGSKWEKFTSPVKRCFDHKADALLDVCANPREWFPQMTADGMGPEGADMKHLLGLKSENIVLVDDVRTNFQSNSLPDQPRVLRYCKVARYDSEYRDMGLVTNMGGLGARTLEDYSKLEDFVREPWKFKEVNGLRCTERDFDEADSRPPVALAVLDFDETISIYTFMPEGDDWKREIGYNGKTAEERGKMVKYNFHSPYLDGNRVDKLKDMLGRLIEDTTGGARRSLAVLTKNEDGAVAVLNLLLLVGLADHFSAIWALGAGAGLPNGVYRDGKDWKVFSLPMGNVEEECYKAVVLKQVADCPDAWFPQLPKDKGAEWAHMKDLKLFNIVLIDDDRSAFGCKDAQKEDAEELQVLRYCKVAHYDDVYHDQGLLVHMGGIGAKMDSDYDKLINFVNSPWEYRMVDGLGKSEAMMTFCMSSKSESFASEGAPPLERRQDEDASPVPRTRRSVTADGEIALYVSTGSCSGGAASKKTTM